MIGFINPTLRKLEEMLLAADGLDYVPVRNASDLADRLTGTDAVLLSNSVYDADIARILHSAAGLRWIQSTSIGIDSFLAYPPPHDVIVTNAGGLKAASVAEHAVALLLALVRRLDRSLDLQRHARWGNTELVPEMRSLVGMSVVCLGYGAIGREIARKLSAFDATVTAINRSGAGSGHAHKVLPLSGLGEALTTADAVVLALPLTSETRRIIGREQLASMKPSAFIANVGRGELLDEEALADALRDRRIGGAGLDVFEIEPLSEHSPLWFCPNMVITPHMGGHGGDGDSLLTRLILDNAALLQRGAPLLNTIVIS